MIRRGSSSSSIISSGSIGGKRIIINALSAAWRGGVAAAWHRNQQRVS